MRFLLVFHIFLAGKLAGDQTIEITRGEGLAIGQEIDAGRTYALNAWLREQKENPKVMGFSAILHQVVLLPDREIRPEEFGSAQE